MKLLYLTVPSYFDLEISLIRELSIFCDIKVLVIVSPESQNSSAFVLDELKKEPGVFPWSSFESLKKYSTMIKPEQWFIANNPNNSLISGYRLAKIMKRWIKDADIVHCTTDCKTMLFCLPTIYSKKNTLYTVHDPTPHSVISFARKCYIKLGYICFHNLLFLSQTYHDLIRKEFKNFNVFYSKLGIYDYLCTYQSNRVIDGDYILFFGRIDEYKGVDLLIQSYHNSSLQENSIKLVIAGKGIINCDGIPDRNIILLNRYIRNDELASLIKYSLFVVLPYRTVTQSGVLKSAYAFDKPVVASRVGSFANEIKDGEEGVLVNPSDEKDLCRGLEQMAGENLERMSVKIHNRYSASGEEGWTSIAYNLVQSVYNVIVSQE